MTPELSIVVTARNDNHGGDLLRRMQIFTDSLIEQAARHLLRTELIIVEWNPPPDRPGLAQALRFPAPNGFISVRILRVGPEIHRRYKYAERLPLYQMIAKNAGIRRARGKFVLATNIDILFSDELFSFLARTRLDPDRLYRADRCDVPAQMPEQAALDEKLAWCRNNILRTNSRDGTHTRAGNHYHRIFDPPHLLQRRMFTRRTRLHTNGCGDFTLLSREAWHRLRGYPELDMFSFHIDSLFCFMAHHGGARELCLPPELCVYHIEHQSGWTPETHQSGALDERLKRDQIPQLSNADFNAMAKTMTVEDRPVMLNREDWGLQDDVLPEETVLETSTPGAAAGPAAKPEIRGGKYLSLVITARNDNHGGNMLDRLRVFAQRLGAQCARHGLEAELILVEWNPPPDNPSLREAVDWPETGGPLDIRWIRVPPEIHARYANHAKIPLYQMIAKNAGIRRARGEFVLATNIDILMSEELARFLSLRALEKNGFYRIDRHDLRCRTLPSGLEGEALEAFLRRNTHRLQAQEGTRTAGPMPPPEISPADFALLDAEEIRKRYLAEDSAKMHTNACGDFTLMHKSHWGALRGYPEWDKWSIYLDGILVHTARAANLRQWILKDPMRVYHIEHDMGWAVKTDTVKDRPSLDFFRDYVPWCQRMMVERRPLIVNSPDWGLSRDDLEEALIGTQRMEPAVRP